MLGTELSVLFRRKRTWAMLAALAAVPILIAIAVRVTRAGSGGAGPAFLDRIENNGLFVVFVALFSAALGTEKLTVATWLAVLLTVGATVLLSGGHARGQRDAIFRSLLYGFSAAAL